MILCVVNSVITKLSALLVHSNGSFLLLSEHNFLLIFFLSTMKMNREKKSQRMSKHGSMNSVQLEIHFAK